MKLEEIIKECGFTRIDGDAGIEITSITSDSRKVNPGAIFIAVKGYAGDGHRFIASALEKGAAAIMYEDRQELEVQVNAYKANGGNVEKTAFVEVKNSRHAEAMAAAAFYGNPSHELTLVGITGTNGKTTTKEMIAAVLSQRFSTLKTQANFNNAIREMGFFAVRQPAAPPASAASR